MKKIEIYGHGASPSRALDAANSNCEGSFTEAELDAARKQCEAAGIRWTARREQMFGLLLKADAPVKPYDLMRILQSEGQIAPPTVYRALEALVVAGLVHRIPSLNAFVACRHTGALHTPSFLICETCQGVEEIPTSAEDLMEVIRRNSTFHPRELAIEVFGRCVGCQPSRPGAESS